MPQYRWQWLFALLLAFAFHVAVVTALLWQPANSQQGFAMQAGTGGITIALGPAGAAPGSLIDQVTEKQAQVEPMKLEPESRPKPVMRPVQKIKPQPDAQPKPVARKVIDRKTFVEQVESSESEVVSVSGAAGKSGTQDKPDNGNAHANDSTGGGVPGNADDYIASLQAWLEHHKEYPRRAQRRRQQGTAMLYIVMNRNGEVIRYQLKQSSGYRLLDKEVIAMIERAQPLPAIPDDMNRSQLELLVPVQFVLR